MSGRHPDSLQPERLMALMRALWDRAISEVGSCPLKTAPGGRAEIKIVLTHTIFDQNGAQPNSLKLSKLVQPIRRDKQAGLSRQIWDLSTILSAAGPCLAMT